MFGGIACVGCETGVPGAGSWFAGVVGAILAIPDRYEEEGMLLSLENGGVKVTTVVIRNPVTS